MTKAEPKDAAADAIRQVLEAEHLAEQQLRRCHQEARHLLDEAREQARAIEARAEARIHRVHRDRQERIARLREQTDNHCDRLNARSPCSETDVALIERVVEDAVARLLEPVSEKPT